MRLGLILTNDWELFGDGSGEYFEIQHNPLLEMLDILQSSNAKITLMAEVRQQLSYKKLAGAEASAKHISEAWETIILKAISLGNDVQLHIHPQWIEAQYQNGHWQLNMNNWSIAALPKEIILNEISQGKAYLENLIKPLKSGYRCLAFRAGAYCIQPPESVIKALKETEIYCDTSVTKNLNSPGFYDFSHAKSHIIPWYTTADDVCGCGTIDQGVLEIPIYSEQGLDSPALKKFFPKLYYWLKFGLAVNNKELDWQKQKDKIKNQRYPRSHRFYKSKTKKNLRWLLNGIINRSSIQLDYDFMPASVFIKSLKNILSDKKLKKDYKDLIIPVVALGHIKDIHNCNNIKDILYRANSELGDSFIYWTLSEAYDYWYNKV